MSIAATSAAPVLYHYTCDHWVHMIRRGGVLQPKRQIQLGMEPPPLLIWLTDLPDAAAFKFELGLQSETIGCDRTRYRFRVEPGQEGTAVPWPTYARRRVPGDARALLEFERLPMHWWVSAEPLRVVET